MSAANDTHPILIELDEATREEQLDRAAKWFGNTLMVQAAFRKLAEDTLEKVKEPYIHQYLTEIADKAREHEEKARELHRIIGRDPSTVREVSGAFMGKTREALADLMGTAGGAASPWRDLHQLFLASLNSVGAFGVAEQLGLALGIPEIVEIVLSVNSDKFAHHRQLQELVLDMAPAAILYDMEI